jgi:hypothetical protein
LSSDREVNRLRAMVHQLNMGFSHTMREDGQKRKIVGQEHEAPAYGSVALPANFSSESLGDGASGVDVIDSSDETQLRISREEMVEWVEEVSNPVLYSSDLIVYMETDLSEKSGKRVAWQHESRPSFGAVPRPI